MVMGMLAIASTIMIVALISGHNTLWDAAHSTFPLVFLFLVIFAWICNPWRRVLVLTNRELRYGRRDSFMWSQIGTATIEVRRGARRFLCIRLRPERVEPLHLSWGLWMHRLWARVYGVRGDVVVEISSLAVNADWLCDMITRMASRQNFVGVTK